MIAPTHLTFGLFFTLFGVTVLGYTIKINALAYVFGAIGSVLPDIDTPRSIIGRIFYPISTYLDRRFGHRTVTHSLLAWFVLSLISLPLFFWHKEYFFFFSLSYLSHLILDMANVQGITLLWPDRRRDVLGQIAMRLPTGDRKEIILMIVFIILSILSLPLSQYGWKNSMGFMIGDHQSAAQIYLRSDKQSYLDFKGINSVSRVPIEGKALILERYGEKGFIIGLNGKIFTIGNSGDVDILSSQERIAYTKEPEQKKRLSFETLSFNTVLQKIPQSGYIKGEIIIPDTYEVKIPVKLQKRFKISDHVLELTQSTKAEIKTIRVTRLPQTAELHAKEVVAKAKQNFVKVKTDLYNDGYTDLGRKQLGIDHTKDSKYIEAQSAIKTAEQQLATVLALRNNEIWSASLEIR